MSSSINSVIETQETNDYAIGKHIIERLFNDKLSNIVKREAYSATDMLFTASTKSRESHYSIEIKSIYKDYYKDEGFILKVSKWLSAIQDSDARDSTEGVFALYIVPKYRRWYIYNLRQINLNTAHLENKMIKVTQYADTQKVLTPIILLYTNEAVVSGGY